MARLGIIARSDLTGLGNQSRNWVRLLNPHKIIRIDSTPFNGNEQHPEWYEGYKNKYVVNGFITHAEIDQVLHDIDVLLTFEIPYNYNLISTARQKGVKTIIQNNWEFTDYLQRPELPLPDLLVNHSYWGLETQKLLFPLITEYCPTPIFVDDYNGILDQNLNRDSKKRFLHVAGRNAYLGRNGTQDLLEAVKLIPQDVEFELVIKAQTAEFGYINDPRVKIDRSSPLDEKELYRDFDAMILPRRYGGASLPMTEALASGLPVIMTDISPNDKVLPREWLVPSEQKDAFMARTTISVYSADHASLAHTIIDFSRTNLYEQKLLAREIALREYSDDVVREKWALLMKKLGV